MGEFSFKPKFTFLYALIIIASIVFLATVFYYYHFARELSAMMFDALTAGIFILAILGMIATFLKYVAINYHVTEHEVILKEGIITKTKRSVPFSKIDNITIRRALRDLILDTGTIHIDTPGGPGNAIDMHFIDAGKLVAIEERIKAEMRESEERKETKSHKHSGRREYGAEHEPEDEPAAEERPAEEKPAKKKKGPKPHTGQETL